MNIKPTTEQAQQIEIELCKRECEYFVEEYVKIEDKDVPGSVISFKLWKEQKQVLKDFIIYRLIQILKARQLGLTWLALSYAIWQMIFVVGYSVIALSKTDDDAKELVRRAKFILNHLPAWLVPKWDGNMESITIYHKEPSTFQSFAASQNAGRSFTANLVLLDEWAFQQWAREIWVSVFPSVNRPTGGQVIGLSTIQRGTLFEEIWLDAKSKFHKIFLPYYSDPRRNLEWYEDTKKELKDAIKSEYPATVEEALSIPGGAFFSEFNSLIHLRDPIDYIPEWYNRYRFMDYGLDMLACYFAYVDSQGFARIYREIHKPNLVISEAAYEILKASGCNMPETVEKWNVLTKEKKKEIANKAVEKFNYTYAPPDLFNRMRDTGKSSAEIWAENGIILTKTKNALEAGCIALTNWLHPITLRHEQTGLEYQTAKLTIDKGCAPALVKSLLNIQKDKNRPEVYSDKPHELTHSISAATYFSTEFIYEPVKPKDEPNEHFMKLLREVQRGNQIEKGYESL